MNVFKAMDVARNTIRYAFAITAYADEWGNAIEEAVGEGYEGMPNLSGVELTEAVPAEKMPSGYMEFAEKTIRRIEEENGRGIVAIALDVIGDVNCPSSSLEEFGASLYMDSVGHGSGLWDAFGERAEIVKIPYVCAPLLVVSDNVEEYL